MGVSSILNLKEQVVQQQKKVILWPIIDKNVIFFTYLTLFSQGTIFGCHNFNKLLLRTILYTENNKRS